MQSALEQVYAEGKTLTRDVGGQRNGGVSRTPSSALLSIGRNLRVDVQIHARIPSQSRRFMKTVHLASLLTLLGCKPDAADARRRAGGRWRRAARQTPSRPDGQRVRHHLVRRQGARRVLDRHLHGPRLLHWRRRVSSSSSTSSTTASWRTSSSTSRWPPAAMQAASTDQPPVVLDQKGCQYTPHVVGVHAGWISRVPQLRPDHAQHPHGMPAAVGNPPIDISQGPAGAPRTTPVLTARADDPRALQQPPLDERLHQRLPTPFFAVSDANGRFDLRGLPPGHLRTRPQFTRNWANGPSRVTVAAKRSGKADTSFILQRKSERRSPSALRWIVPLAPACMSETYTVSECVSRRARCTSITTPYGMSSNREGLHARQSTSSTRGAVCNETNESRSVESVATYATSTGNVSEPVNQLFAMVTPTDTPWVGIATVCSGSIVVVLPESCSERLEARIAALRYPAV